MKRRIKVLSLVLSLLLFFLVPIPFQTTVYAVPTNGISVSKNELIQGETFNVSLNIPSLSNADTASLRIEFDPDIFEVTSDVTPWANSFGNGLATSGIDYIALSAANYSQVINLTNGLTLTASLQVKSTAPNGNYDIKLVKNSLSITDGAYSTDLWYPTTKTVTVKVGADDTYPKTTGGISVSKSEVKAGEQFTASINIPAMTKNADTATLKVEFDQNAFEVTSWSPELPGKEPNYGAGFFSVSASNARQDIDLSRGLTLTANLKAKDNASIGDNTFRLTKWSLSYVDTDGITNVELWNPTNTTAGIRVIKDEQPVVIPSTGGGITVSKSQLKRSEEFTVSVNISKMVNADTASIKVEFNGDIFDVTEWNPNIAGGISSYGYGYFGVSAANSSRDINLTNGLTLSAKLKVKSNVAAGSYNISLSKNNLSYVDESDGYTNIPLWDPAAKNVSVNVSADNGFPVAGGGISLSKSQARKGDTFTATVTIPAIDHKADTASIRVEFDTDAFEVTSWDPNITGGTANSGAGYFSVSAANATQAIDLSKGLKLTANIKTKNNSRLGDFTFTLKKYSVSFVGDDGYSNKELWNPRTTTASVTVTDKPEPMPETFPVSGGGISLSRSEIYAGDTFDVYVSVPAINAMADTASIKVEFDGNSFDIVSWNHYISGGVPTQGYGYFGLSASNYGKYIDLSRGMTFTATLRAKYNANPGSYRFELTRGSFSYIKDNGYEYQELWNPTTAMAYLRIANYRNPVISSYDPWNYPVVTSTKDTTTTTTTKTHIDPSDDDNNDDGHHNIIDDDDDEINNDTTKAIKNITLESELTGLDSGRIRTSTKRKFFNGDTVILLRNTVNANKMALKALQHLGFSNHEYYALDISLYETTTGKFLSSLKNNGYVEFWFPLPKNLHSVSKYISVYHVENGVPEYINSSIVVDDGQEKIYFKANSFSPYMFVDTVNEKQIEVVDTGNKIITDDNNNSDNYNGYSNPNTGAAAAIIIPAALTGCIILAKKDKQRRKRSKR